MRRDEIETIPTIGRTIKSVVWSFYLSKKRKKKKQTNKLNCPILQIANTT